VRRSDRITDYTLGGIAFGAAVLVLALLLSRRVHQIPEGSVGVVTLLGMNRGILLPGLHITPALARVVVVKTGSQRAPPGGMRSN